MTDRQIRELLVRIEADLGLVDKWGEIDDKGINARGAVGYGGKGKRWQFLLVGIPSSEGRMGTAVRLPFSGVGVNPLGGGDPSVVNLPPELAAKAFAIAAKAVKEGR